MSVLILVDIQKEYIAEGRPFCLDTIAESLDNCRKLQAHAREKGWKVIHMHHVQNAEVFGYGSEFSEYIDGFGPQGEELSLSKSDFSCFTSAEFTALVDKYRHEDIILAGYGCTMCCLSTLIDAHHRGYNFYFVKDATCAKRTEKFSEQELKDFTIDILPAYANLVTTEQVLNKAEGNNGF